MRKEIAVIFKRKEQPGKVTMFIPHHIVIGNLDESDNTFIDIDGNKYPHMVIKNNKYGFGLRTSIKELNTVYKVSSLKELITTYSKHIKEYIYYYYCPSSEKAELKDLILMAEDKKYHTILPMEDNDFKAIVEEINKKANNHIDINTNNLVKAIKDKIIAQDEAIDQIVSILWQNYRSKRKSNMLLIGPTGTGKTEIVRLIAKELNIPILIANAASLTQSGYTGESVDDILKNLITTCNGDIKKAEKGIIILDELDKLAGNIFGNDTIATSGVQDELLKLIEDGTYYLNMGEFPNDKRICINTKDITFIGAGAFDDLNTKIKPNKVIGGFNQQPNNNSSDIKSEITNEALIKYGLKPELVGRLSNIIKLNPLTKEDLIQIMKNPNNDTINEKIRILSNLNITTKIEDNVYEQLANDAIKKNVGARGIINSVETLFNSAMLEVSKDSNAYQELILTEETVKNPKNYTLIRKKEGKGN